MHCDELVALSESPSQIVASVERYPSTGEARLGIFKQATQIYRNEILAACNTHMVQHGALDYIHSSPQKLDPDFAAEEWQL